MGFFAELHEQWYPLSISMSTSSMYVCVCMYLFVSSGNEVLLWKAGETVKN